MDKGREARRAHWGCGHVTFSLTASKFYLGFTALPPCLLSFGPKGPILPRSEKVQFGDCGGPLPVLKGPQLQAALSYPSIYERTSDNRGKEGRKEGRAPFFSQRLEEKDPRFPPIFLYLTAPKAMAGIWDPACFGVSQTPTKQCGSCVLRQPKCLLCMNSACS